MGSTLAAPPADVKTGDGRCPTAAGVLSPMVDADKVGFEAGAHLPNSSRAQKWWASADPTHGTMTAMAHGETESMMGLPIA